MKLLTIALALSASAVFADVGKMYERYEVRHIYSGGLAMLFGGFVVPTIMVASPAGGTSGGLGGSNNSFSGNNNSNYGGQSNGSWRTDNWQR